MIELLLVAEQLLADGALDRAEHLFAQVADADPRNAIAVAGLARVALANGHRPQALEFARRALAIDPDEAAALRLIAELEAAEPQVAGADSAGREVTEPQAAEPQVAEPQVAGGDAAEQARTSLWSRILRAVGLRK